MKSIAGPHRDELALIELDLLRDSVSAAVTGLDGYRRVLEHLLREAEENDFEALKQRLQNAPALHCSRILDADYPYWWQQAFIPQFRGSFRVWAVSVVEFHMAWTARIAEVLCRTALGRKARGESVVQQYRRFFSQRVKFEAPPNGMWDQLADAYVVRNALAHTSDTAVFESDKRKQKLELAIRAFGSPQVDVDSVELDSSHCEAMAELAAKVCHYLLNELDRAAGRSRPVA